MKIFKNKFADFEFKTIYITDSEYAKKVIKTIDTKSLLGLDIETSKLYAHKDHPMAGLCPKLSRIRLLQIYNGKEDVYVFDMFKIPWKILESILKAGRFVAHNGIFEVQFLTYQGYPNLNIGCSMLLSQLVEGAEHSPFEKVKAPSEDEEEDDQDQSGLSKYKRVFHNLDAVTQRLFGYKVEKKEQVSDWGKEELTTSQITYAGLDAVLTYKVAQVLAKKIKEYKMEKAYKLMKDMQHVVAEMQLEGLPVDWEYHKNLIDTWKDKSDKAFKNCKPYFGETNMRSGKQMNEWLKDYLKKEPLILAAWPKTAKCKCKDKKSGCICGAPYAFSKTAITKFSHLPAIGVLLEYKKYAKLIDTYGDSLIMKKHPVTGRLHTSYTLGETRTYRLSSRDPNCQNYPRDAEFRNMFKAEKGYVFVVSDFSQIELRLQAEFSKDPNMLKAYKEKSDIYKTMASSLFGVPIEKISKDQRFVGKTVMLALGYGMGVEKLMLYGMNAGIKQPFVFWDAAHKTYHRLFNVYSKWCDRMRHRAEKLGFIETLLGARRKLVESENYTRAPNTVIQGTAAELMKKAMLICQKQVHGIAAIVLTAHDEILLVTPNKHAEKAKTCLADSMNASMREMFPKAVSFDVADAAYAARWGEAKAEL